MKTYRNRQFLPPASHCKALTSGNANGAAPSMPGSIIRHGSITDGAQARRRCCVRERISFASKYRLRPVMSVTSRLSTLPSIAVKAFASVVCLTIAALRSLLASVRRSNSLTKSPSSVIPASLNLRVPALRPESVWYAGVVAISSANAF